MGLFNIAVVSDKNSWISPYVQDLRQKLESQGHTVFYANNFDNIRGFDIVFILSFSRIITERQLKQNTHNLVVHESALPHGKGWSPLTWQILEGKESFPITLFEAAPRVDSGKIYLQKDLHFTGNTVKYRTKHASKISKNFCRDRFERIDQDKKRFRQTVILQVLGEN